MQDFHPATKICVFKPRILGLMVFHYSLCKGRYILQTSELPILEQSRMQGHAMWEYCRHI